MAKYQLKFETDTLNQTAGQGGKVKSNEPQAPAEVKHALIKVLNGSNAGKQLVLSKELTTLGTPGVQVATISRIQNQYLIRHVEGEKSALVNERAIGKNALELKQGDVIDLSGTRLMFSFS